MKHTIKSHLVFITLICISLFSIKDVIAQNPPPPSITTVRSVAWNPDGIWIARAFQNGTVEVLNTSTNTVIFSFNNGQSPATALAWRPGTGSTQLAASIGNNVYIWNIPNTSIIFTLSASGNINSLDWTTQGGEKLVGAAFNGSSPNLRIWNPSNGQQIFGKGIGQLSTASWNPTGTLLVVGDGLGVKILNPSNSQLNLLSANSLELSFIQSVAWSPDGTKIATSGVFGQVTIWNAVTGQFMFYTERSRYVVNWLSWSNDSSKLASASWDGTVRLWNANTGAELGVIQSSGERVFAVDWSPDNTKLVYGTENGISPIISISNVTSSQTGTGLRGQYFDTADVTTGFKFFRLSPTINFNWAGASPDTAIAADTFSVRWTGKVEPLYSETYTFYVTHNDGARLWVNGQQIINNWVNRTTAVTSSGTITLAAGVKYDIQLEYYENSVAASVNLEWSSPTQARQVIPASQLYAPEGQLAFTGRTSGVDEVYVLNPDGTGEINLSNHAAQDNYSAWSPDGTKLAFVSTRDGNEEIYLVNADGTGLRRLTNHAAADNQPAWSPDGTKIAFTSARTGAGDIYLMTITGTGVPTPTRRTTNTAGDSNPMWSPNGLYITYEGSVSTNPEIYIIGATSGSPIRLTNRNGIDGAPFWSPDGSKIAFRSAYNSATDQIWIVNTTSPYTLTKLTTLGTNFFISWSADGAKILFQSDRSGNVDIFTMDANGANQTNLTNSAANEAYAIWSPDARQIAYRLTNDIYMMNRDGSNVRQLTNTPSRTEQEIVWWQTKQTR